MQPFSEDQFASFRATLARFRLHSLRPSFANIMDESEVVRYYHVVKGVGPTGGGTGEPEGALGSTREDWGVLGVARLPTPP